MGTPSAPDLANVTLALSETSFLEQRPRFKLFHGYIDDIFLHL